MKLPSVEYEAPTTTAEVVALLAEHQDEASVLAGGQSLIPLLAMRLARPAVLIDINGVTELSGVSRVNGSLAIGAMTSASTRQRNRRPSPAVTCRCSRPPCR